MYPRSFSFRRVVAALTVVAGIGLALSACSSTDEKKYVEEAVEVLYNRAMDEMEAEEFDKAVPLFEEVERQHPYSKWATKAQIMSGYASYRANKYDQALVSLDRFIQLHPSSADVPYGYYLKALCYYEQISDVARDQKMTQLAMDTLRELITRFPESRYARDAKLKLDLTHDHLAGKEMDIGRYYLRQGEYLAAINRFRLVVDKYQTTTHAPEALHRLAEAYTALGLTDEAKKAASVLGHNFPGSEWYIDSYEMVEGKKIRKETPDGGPWYKFW